MHNTASRTRCAPAPPAPPANHCRHISPPRLTAPTPLCSGRVYKAKLRGETIAVKEIDLGASEANRRTFLTVSVQCTCWGLRSDCCLLACTASRCVPCLQVEVELQWHHSNGWRCERYSHLLQ